MMAEEARPPPIVVGNKSFEIYAHAIATRYGRGDKVIVVRALGTQIEKALDAANHAVKVLGLMLDQGGTRWGWHLVRGRMISWLEITLVARPGSEGGNYNESKNMGP